MKLQLVVLFCVCLARVAVCQDCGSQANGASCAAAGFPGMCCSQYGYCGTTAAYCSAGCQGHCVASYFVGYISSWATSNPAACNLIVANIDATKYTHINVAFATFAASTWALSAVNNDDKGFYASVQALKSKNANLKVSISIGGGGFPATRWSNMASTAAGRTMFINNAISFARTHNFDGIDIDWEVPANKDTANIKALMAAFRSNITADATSRSKPALLLTLAAPNYNSAIQAFGFASIYQDLDFIGVMNYDYYGGDWSKVVGGNTCFNGTDGENIITTMKSFAGVPNNKLLLGFANYARTFTLTNAAQNTPGSPTTGNGVPGSCTNDAGTLNYNEVTQYISSHAGTSAFDSKCQTPYYYYSTNWVTYDNVQSLTVKINYLQTQGYLGAMMWEIDVNTTIPYFIAAKIL